MLTRHGDVLVNPRKPGKFLFPHGLYAGHGKMAGIIIAKTFVAPENQ
jgi:hypothetical protein